MSGAAFLTANMSSRRTSTSVRLSLGVEEPLGGGERDVGPAGVELVEPASARCRPRARASRAASRPIGERRPRGDVTVTTSPTPTLSESASAAPRRTGAGPSAGASSAGSGPSRTFATTSVTVRSSAGTMPLSVATAAAVVLVMSTLP